MDNLIGERIKDFRKAANLTQKQLGERIGVSGAMIGQYETGVRKPKQETVERIAQALGTNIGNFYFKHGHFVSSDEEYPERDTFEEVIADIVDYSIKRATPDDLKAFLNNTFDDLDDAGKIELCKKAMILYIKTRRQTNP